MIEIIKEICEQNGYIHCEGAISYKEEPQGLEYALFTDEEKNQYYALFQAEVKNTSDIDMVLKYQIFKSNVDDKYLSPSFDKNTTSIFILKTEEINNKEINEKIVEIYKNMYSSMKTVLLYNNEQEEMLNLFLEGKELISSLREYVQDYSKYTGLITKQDDYLLYDIISKIFIAVPCFDLYNNSDYSSFPLLLTKMVKNNNVVFEANDDCHGFVFNTSNEELCNIFNPDFTKSEKILKIYKANNIPFKIDFIFKTKYGEKIFIEKNGNGTNTIYGEESNIIGEDNRQSSTEEEFKILHYIYSGKVFGLGLIHSDETKVGYTKIKTMVEINPELYVNEEIYEMLSILHKTVINYYMYDPNIIFVNFKGISSEYFTSRIIEIIRRIDKVMFITGLNDDFSRYLRYKFFKYGKSIKSN